MVSIAKKLDEPEFLSFAVGDRENMPAIQLNAAEMALIKGGSWGGWLSGAAVVVGGLILGGMVCGNIMDNEKPTATGTGTGTVKIK